MTIKSLRILLMLGLFAWIGSAGSAEAAKVRLVVLGDSLSAGYGLGPGEGFTEQLQKALTAKGEDVEVVNAGVSGDTADSGLQRLDWSVDPSASAVIVELGANDMLRGFDPAATRTAIDAILTKLQARKLPVLVAGMRAAPNLGADYQTKFDGIFADLAKAHGAALYPFFLDGVAAQANLLQADGMHPNPTGVGIIVQRILPAVEALIAEAKR
jgi:acyl-CoA thioesterase-1